MRVLDKMPTDLHERTPLVIGSKKEVEKVQGYLVG
jgi:fructose-1,6-bisphosphatase